MSKEKFVPVNGAYNITSAQVPEFTQFLRNKIKTNNKFTSDGKPSKSGVITKTFIDGKLQQFRNRARKGDNSVNSFAFASQVSKNKEVMATALKFAQARLSPPTFGQIAGEAALKSLQENMYGKNFFHLGPSRDNSLFAGFEKNKRELDFAELHWYFKDKVLPGRKLGHITVPLHDLDPKLRTTKAMNILKKVRAIWPFYVPDIH